MKKITMLLIILGIVSSCTSPIAPTNEPTIEELWEIAEAKVFSIPYKAYSSWFPSFQDALEISPINCSCQAVLLHGYFKDILPDPDNVKIVMWKYYGIRVPHANVIVTTHGENWAIDRNYGPTFPEMPMRENEWLEIYSGKIERKIIIDENIYQ